MEYFKTNPGHHVILLINILVGSMHLKWISVCVYNVLSTTYAIITTRGFCGVTSRGSSDKEPTCQRRRQGLTLELRRFPWVGNGNPLQCSCSENPMNREAWHATVHGAAESQTRLSTHTHTIVTSNKISNNPLVSRTYFILKFPQLPQRYIFYGLSVEIRPKSTHWVSNMSLKSPLPWNSMKEYYFHFIWSEKADEKVKIQRGQVTCWMSQSWKNGCHHQWQQNRFWIFREFLKSQILIVFPLLLPSVTKKRLNGLNFILSLSLASCQILKESPVSSSKTSGSSSLQKVLLLLLLLLSRFSRVRLCVTP